MTGRNGSRFLPVQGTESGLLRWNYWRLCHTKYTYGKVTICENAWIGMNVTICPGVTVGKYAVVGADITDFPKENFPAAVLKNNSIKNLAERKRRQTVQYSA